MIAKLPWTRKLLENYKLVLLVLISAAVYANTLALDFVFDDLTQITENREIESWSSLPSYFTTHVWSFMYKEWFGNYYRPLFMVWLRFNHMLFSVGPAGWHFTTVVLHAWTTLLVFFFGRRVTRDVTVALWAALLFAVHPIHTEAVAWVSGVTEPLLMIPMLGALLYYLRFREEGGRWNLAGSLLCTGLALLTKETAVVIPAIIVCWELTLREGWRSRIRAAASVALPYAALVSLYLLARANALHGLSNTIMGVDGPTVVYTMPSVTWFYIRLMLWPTRLGLYHENPLIYSPLAWEFLVPLAGCILLVVLAIWMAFRWRIAALALPLLILPMVPPLIGIGALGPNDISHDRYLYGPSAALFILLAWGLKSLAERWSVSLWRPAALVAVFSVVFSAMTWQQNTKWQNSYTIWYHTAWAAPGNPKAWNQLGASYLRDARHAEAIPHLLKARSIDPDIWRVNYSLGITYLEMQNWAEAERYLKHAVAVFPADPKVQNSYQYFQLGRAAMRNGHPEIAEEAFKKAIAINPRGQDYYFALGYLHREQGRLAEARAAFVQQMEYQQGSLQDLIRDLDARMAAASAN